MGKKKTFEALMAEEIRWNSGLKKGGPEALRKKFSEQMAEEKRRHAGLRDSENGPEKGEASQEKLTVLTPSGAPPAQELTPWFPADVKPVHVGWYHTNVPFFRETLVPSTYNWWWDGHDWIEPPRLGQSIYQNRRWRGRTQP